MINDPIADMLIRLKNGYLARRQSVAVPYSKLKEGLAQILVEEGYVLKVKIEQNEQKKDLVLRLKYQDGQPACRQVRRISKPGRRIYLGVTKLPRVLGGLGIAVVSTPRGLMTAKEARRERLGGEVICEVW
jgi:small subunit ribosomal protein S8